MSEFTLALLNLGLRPQPRPARGRAVVQRDDDEILTSAERGAMSRWRLLEALRRGGRRTIADLSQSEGLARSTVSQQLRALEHAGLAEAQSVVQNSGGRPLLLWQAAGGDAVAREAA
ncbi:ArsR family transcriptional regulator [Thauera aromatica]|uniref:ArsR family transcriptional regulator n=1 Tax=Thauera aromatica TaxID=59405 RepID=UPI001FFD5D85|nr:helix-turn-helix domain-containing protein [Thauera aromatica]MCK2097251.1 transcriptional regulator [Thauera aromatica]